MVYVNATIPIVISKIYYFAIHRLLNSYHFIRHQKSYSNEYNMRVTENWIISGY